MPFPMKIQPIDCHSPEEVTRFEPVKPVVKSRLKRLFELQFLRNSTTEKVGVVIEESQPLHLKQDNNSFNGPAEFEPSSVCLAKMVQNFIEENNEKQVKCGRNRCNCFNGNCNDSSDDELESYFGDSCLASAGEACEILKSLVVCESVNERNLLADTSKIVEKNKICKRKDENCRKIVTDGLLALGYDASICKSRWDKSPSYPAGDYEYIDVIIEGERLIIDIDFRSEFEIARPTKTYKSILQTLPYIFIGKSDRLTKIIGVVSEAAKQSLKKKGMHIPPWRKGDYIKAKWVSPHPRASDSEIANNNLPQSLLRSNSEFELSQPVDDTELGDGESVFVFSDIEENEKVKIIKNDCNPPAEIKPKRSVTGLADDDESSKF